MSQNPIIDFLSDDEKEMNVQIPRPMANFIKNLKIPTEAGERKHLWQLTKDQV